jgi:hypothetical protein
MAQKGGVGDVEGQVFFPRLYAGDADGLVDLLAQIEFDVFNGEGIRFNLGEIEKVVDEVHQIIGAEFQRIDEFARLVRQFHRFQKIGKADDGVHRRAQFMAHIRHEFILLAAAFTQGFFRLDPFADVARDFGCADDFP